MKSPTSLPSFTIRSLASLFIDDGDGDGDGVGGVTFGLYGRGEEIDLFQLSPFVEPADFNLNGSRRALRVARHPPVPLPLSICPAS